MKNKQRTQVSTWHEQHSSKRTFGQRVADSMGSWSFMIIQTIIVVV
ncbi:MAG: hypothetical protein ACOYVG_06420 [Bacteroidota bacterium]